MIRIMAILPVAVLAMVALLAAACGDEGEDEPEGEPSRLAVQNAEFATFVSSGDTYTLTMEGTDDITIWFTDRPVRDAGAEDTGAVMSWAFNPSNPDGPPNAAVVWDADGEEHAVAMELVSGVYDPESATLTYEAMPLESHDGSLAHFGRSAEIPTERVGPVTVFLDNILGIDRCEMDITNQARIEPGLWWTVDITHGDNEEGPEGTALLGVGDKVLWSWIASPFDVWCEVTVSLNEFSPAGSDDPLITYYMINPKAGSSNHHAKCSPIYICATKTLHNTDTYHVIMVFCEAGVSTTDCLARGGYDNPQ